MYVVMQQYYLKEKMKIDGHLDLFSGIGGFSLGLKQAGIESKCLGFSDINKYANKLFKRRFPNAKELGSVTDVSYKSLRGQRIDLLTGGFPCQAFSIAGKRKGFDDTRGTLFFEIQRILEDYIRNGKPISCILLENVKGLLNHDNHRTFVTIYGILCNLNYTVECQLVNTKWWLPQNRERIYIFGRYNGNPSGRKVFPIYENGRKIKNTKQLGNIDQKGHNSIWGRVYDTDGIASTLNSEGGGLGAKTGLYKVTTHSLYPRSGNPKQGGTGHLSKEDGTAYCLDTGNAQAIEVKSVAYRTRSYRGEDGHIEERKDNISNCLNSQTKDYMLKVKSRIRRLTPIECERLQGFPDGWTDGQSDTQRYKQLGNAVSVPVTKAIFRKIYYEKNTLC